MAGIIRTLPGAQGTLGQPTAQVIDGSLKFDSASSQYLKSTSTFQNTKSYEMTFSFWLKRSATTGQKETQYVFSSNVEGTIFFDNGNSDQLGFNLRGSSGSNFFTYTEAKLRDYNSWYHIVVALNLGSGTESERFKCYINGVQQTMSNASYPSNAYHTGGTWYIGAYQGGPSHHPDYHLTNFYCISGQVLDPTYFGFTDPLTNTWKPKKYTGTFTFDNSFYLPMDGNSRIGKDMSGSENDWTPINFNGSVPLDSDIITGGRPILNTTQGGSQAGVGVFGSLENKYYTLTGSSGSGSGYVFENEGTKPTLSMIRGVTYTFNYSAASSHPFRFATAADAAGSTEYTTGTNISGNSIKITVPHDAPDTLYYYCTNHSGMGNSISVTTDETKADKYASNIVLAVPLVGGSYDFSGCLNCNTGSKVATNSNGPSYVTTLSNFYTGSGDFTGSSTQKRIDYATSGGAFGFGTDDFTIEWWMHATTNADGNHYVWDTTGQRSSLIRKSGGGMTFETYGSSGGIGEVTILSSGSYSLNKWAHWAVVRDGDTVYVYIDGVLKQKTTGFSGVNFGDVDGHIGGYNGGSASYNPDAHLQDFRIYKGVAKYTGTSVDTQYFTVPSRSPDILPDTPSGVSGGSKLTKVTDGAVYFDGTGDYLEIADNADFEMGTDDFTIEAFVYNQEDAVQSMITKYGSGNTTRSFWLGTLTSSRPSFYWYNGSNYYNIDGAVGSLPLNKWSHVVAQRKSGDMYLFVDGKRVSGNTGSNAALSLNDVSEPVVIGSDSYSGGEQPFQGYISNVRIVKGTGVYDVTEDTTLGKQNFIPPTAPLTNVTNTKLLCCQSNNSTTTAAVTPGSITANGDTTTTNFNPFITDINTARGQESNYCTLNPIFRGATGATYSDGNLSCNTGNANGHVRGNIAITTGKYYFEVVSQDSSGLVVGIVQELSIPTYNIGGDNKGYGYLTDGTKANAGYVSYGDSWGAGDVIGVAFNATNGELTFYKNGVSQGVAFTNLFSNPYFPAVSDTSSNQSKDFDINFGQKPFKYAPPNGFQPLSAATTRPETVILRPDQYVKVKTYSGNSGTQSIDMGLKPDLVWIKNRTSGSGHRMVDSVRGATKAIESYDTTAEATETNGVTSFNINGFSVGSQSHYNNGALVAWTWKAGGNKNTYNVDDKGFANASNVNMSVGALNGSAYNTDQIWSGLISPASGSFDQAATLAFDGIIRDSDPNRLRTSGNNILVTMTFSTSVSVSSQVRVHSEPGYDSTCTVTVGGTTYTSSRGSIHTFNVVGSLTQMTLVTNESSSRTYMSGMEVDGKQLVDSNITAPSVPGIAPTGCSVGTKQGFSIIKYTGSGSATSIPHGLLKAPEFVLVKNLANYNWAAWHKGLNDGRYYLFLNNTDSQSNNYYTFWNDSTPTSSVINLGADSSGTNVNANQSGVSHICYSWHSVPGLQKFGQYEGNGNGDGPYVETGFRPHLVACKNIDATQPWQVYDSARDTINVIDEGLQWNSSSSRYTGTARIDFLSNGFKVRGPSGSEPNVNAQTYIYMAWAETPSIDLFGGGANAR